MICCLCQTPGGHEYPEGTYHYKCYEKYAARIKRRVFVADATCKSCNCAGAFECKKHPTLCQHCFEQKIEELSKEKKKYDEQKRALLNRRPGP